MESLAPFLAFLVAAVALVIVSNRLRIPYTISLVLFGFALGFAAQDLGFQSAFGNISEVFSGNFFFDLLLPPIIFEAAIHLNFHFLRMRAGMVTFFVVIGVIFTTFFTGFLVSWVAAIPLVAALLLASILSPTDPIAVVDLLRRMKVPRELSTIVEAESLLNDAVGVILFTILLAIVQGGQANIGASTLQFLWLSGGGAAIGLITAAAIYFLHRRLNDPVVETALTIVTAYGSFVAATAIGASGIVSTAIAGIAFGTFVAPRAINIQGRNLAVEFWRVIVYVANAVIFLSMGFLFSLERLGNYIPLIALVFVTLFAGRAIFIYAHYPIANAWRGRRARLPRHWYNLLTLAGIRGAIPIVLALSLLTTSTSLSPDLLNTIVGTVLGVSFASILIGDISAEWYVRKAFRGPPEETSEASESATTG
ncbi:MAG: cation:proton antiporter [Thermoplasmata archaeon]